MLFSKINIKKNITVAAFAMVVLVVVADVFEVVLGIVLVLARLFCDKMLSSIGFPSNYHRNP